LELEQQKADAKRKQDELDAEAARKLKEEQDRLEAERLKKEALDKEKAMLEEARKKEASKPDETAAEPKIDDANTSHV